MAETIRDDSTGFFSPLVSDGRNFLSLGALGLLASGLFAIFLASTRQFLPHDIEFLGMTARDLCAHDSCRIVHFMVHDRVSFGGALISLSILYFWLIHFPLHEQLAWAWWTILLSNIAGFASFLTYLGFGYLDTWHAIATAVLLPCFAIGLALTFHTLRPPRTIASILNSPVKLQWNTRAGFGRVLMLATAATMIVAGMTITAFGMTVVFVPQDLEYMHTTALQMNALNPRLIPLIAHDRAGFGGSVFNVGFLLLVCTWCGRTSRHQWQALACAAIVGFSTAIGIHPIVGYNNPTHLAPACLGALTFAIGLVLTHASKDVLRSTEAACP